MPDKEPEVTVPEQSQEPETPDTKPPELDARTKQALELFQALEDPNTAPVVIKAMADRLGLLDQKEPESKQQAAPKHTIKDIVKAKLGEQGSFIADELGDVLETLITEQQKVVQQQIQELEMKRAAVEFQREYNQAIEELEISEEEAGKLMELVDEFPWNGKTSVKKYLSNLVNYYRGSKDNATKEKRAANFQQRAKTLSATTDEEKVQAPPTKFNNPKDAVEFALKQLQK